MCCCACSTAPTAGPWVICRRMTCASRVPADSNGCDMHLCGGQLSARRCACAITAYHQASCPRCLSPHRNCWLEMCLRSQTCCQIPAVFRFQSGCVNGHCHPLLEQVHWRCLSQCNFCFHQIHSCTAVPSDPASSVLFLGRPSSRASSMSWSRPTTAAGHFKHAFHCHVIALLASLAGGKLSFAVAASDRRGERAEFSACGSRPASRATSTRSSGDIDNSRTISSRQSARFGIMHAR